MRGKGLAVGGGALRRSGERGASADARAALVGSGAEGGDTLCFSGRDGSPVNNSVAIGRAGDRNTLRTRCNPSSAYVVSSSRASRRFSIRSQVPTTIKVMGEVRQTSPH